MLTLEQKQQIKKHIIHRKSEMRKKFDLRDNGFTLKEIILLHRFNKDKNLSVAFPNIVSNADKIRFMSVVELGRI